MNILTAYIMLTLAQFCALFYVKGSINISRFFNYANNSNSKKIEVLEKVTDRINEPKEILITNTNIDAMEINGQMMLNKSLNHLDFISNFEKYLEDKNYKNFPIEFLQELEKVKVEAKLSTLKISEQLNNTINEAA